jgi:predicted TPR repeat methyltransferase
MPGSVRENDEFVRNWVADNNIKEVLDIGAGKGTYSDLLIDLVDHIDAVEIWSPYITEYGLEKKYDYIYAQDVRTFEPVNDYDLVIFGDVLEHMTEAEAVDVWNRMQEFAKAGLISVPIIHYPQGAEFNNPFEVHVQEHLTPADIRSTYGPFDDEAIYQITGTFIRRFDGS